MNLKRFLISAAIAAATVVGVSALRNAIREAGLDADGAYED